MNKNPCVYLLASKKNGTLYVGVTANLLQRIWQHRNDTAEGFSKRYQTHLLVWYELHAEMLTAITREKAIKKWRRNWKIKLIREHNPDWLDLYPDLL